MSSNKIKNINNGAIIVANDLKTGHSMYFTIENSWSEHIELAQVITSDDEAKLRLNEASEDEDDNLVLDPYLVETDSTGVPVHIREQIRASGPSVAVRATRPLTLAAE